MLYVKKKPPKLDSACGKLSYTKMITTKNARHLTVPPNLEKSFSSDDVVEHKRYSVCRTATGWLWCKKTTGTEVN